MAATKHVNFDAFKSDIERLKAIAAAGPDIEVRCGWLHEGLRTREQNDYHQAVESAMPRFAIRGRFRTNERQYSLWKAGRAVLGNKGIPYIWQKTGSCVGAGGGSSIMTLQCVEIAIKRQAEEFRWPWWLYTYGCSRQRGGLRGRGEGSFGGAFAKAATLDGMFELDPEGLPDLPNPTVTGGYAALDRETELKWSDGARIAQQWRAEGRQHLVRTVSRMRDVNDCIDALANGYPLTIASMLGWSPMVPRPVGNPAVRLVRQWSAQWAHQMFIDEFWDHPSLGPIFRCGNNWGPGAHGAPTGDEPAGGVYLTDDLLGRVLRTRDAEVYAFSAYDGFPARESELNFSAF